MNPGTLILESMHLTSNSFTETNATNLKKIITGNATIVLGGSEFGKLPALEEVLNKILISLRLYFEVNILPGNASCLYHMPRITLHVEGVVLPEYIP